jgi:hypothetical protein
MTKGVFDGGFRVASLCFLLAVALRLALLFGTGLYLKRDRTEMASEAVAFTRTREIANPYMALPTGPTAHVAPLYPMLMGVVYRLFGDGETGETIKQLLASCVSSARVPLVVLLALGFGLGEGVALTAGLVSAVYIGAFETELRGDWEGPLAADVLLLLVLWASRTAWRRVPGPLGGPVLRRRLGRRLADLSVVAAHRHRFRSGPAGERGPGAHGAPHGRGCAPVAGGGLSACALAVDRPQLSDSWGIRMGARQLWPGTLGL